MSDIEIRLFGGFDVRCSGVAVRRFESQKARGLMAYLAMHRDQALSRERAATLLWSDMNESTARRNLRQALYSLRTAFAEADPEADLLVGQTQSVGLHPDLAVRLDVSDFEQAIDEGLDGAEPDSQQLGRAARLYVGDFMSGFFVRDCPQFEEWSGHHPGAAARSRAGRVSHPRGVLSTPRRAAHGDPLRTPPAGDRPPVGEAHRQLMRLYAQSSRRTRALAQFEELRNLLNQELGVEPLTETTALYQSILMEELPKEQESEEAIGPLIPLAGRGEELATLLSSWQQALEGGARLVLVDGETGIGKTRLVKTCIDAASSQRKTRVLRGRAYAAAPAVAFGPWSEIVTMVFADLLPDEGLDPENVDVQTISDLALLAPQLAALDPELLGGPLRPEDADPDRLPEAMQALLTVLTGEAGSSRTPVILMLSDLQWADEESLQLLEMLAPRLAELPVLIVATIDSTVKGARQPLLSDREAAAGIPIDRLTLGRLPGEALAEIADALVPAAHTDWLTGLLSVGPAACRWQSPS